MLPLRRKDTVTPPVVLAVRQQLGRLSRRWRPAGFWRGMSVIGIILALWAGYALPGRSITLVINERSFPMRTHRLTVDAVVRELGLTLAPEDIIQPPPGTKLLPDQAVTIRLARPVTVDADGRTLHLLTHQPTPSGVLAEAGIITNARDAVLVDGAAGAMQTPFPSVPATDPVTRQAAGLLLSSQTPRGVIASARPKPVHLIVRRAIPVVLNDGGIGSAFYTTRPNVGEALLEQGLTLFLGDKVTPNLGTRLSPGMRIYVQRSMPVTVIADGRTVKTRTRQESVGDVLAQEGVALMGQDYSRPALEHLLSDGDTIEVVRVRETLDIEQEFIPFETRWLPDTDMALDRQEVRQTGQTGVIKTRTRVRVENNQEVWSRVEDEWLDQEPQDRLIVYGTQVTVQTLDTEAGPIEYWRKISMLMTPYSAATSGKAPDHPRYGITRSGLKAGYGLVAVDPKVIPLMSKLYVPGYGEALAADTGGLVLGKHVDLGYDEDQPLPDLYEWRDVYVLTPVPPPDEIRYVLPNWPQR